MLITHTLESFLLDLVVEVVLRLLLLFLFLRLLLIIVVGDLGRLGVLLRVHIVDFPKEVAVSHAVVGVFDHIHGHLGADGQEALDMRLAEVVEHFVQKGYQEVLVQ
jgi:hypothetical protein